MQIIKINKEVVDLIKKSMTIKELIELYMKTFDNFEFMLPIEYWRKQFNELIKSKMFVDFELATDTYDKLVNLTKVYGDNLSFIVYLLFQYREVYNAKHR